MKYSLDEIVLPGTETILKLARECFFKEGFYPISFSWPRKFEEPQNQKSNAISTTVPYIPYSFEDADKY
jgi:hypothetical protein